MSAKWIYNEILHKMRVSGQISFWAARGLRADHRDHDCVCHELLKSFSVFCPGSSSQLACSSKDERPGHPAHEEDGPGEVVPHKVKEGSVNLVILML